MFTNRARRCNNKGRGDAKCKEKGKAKCKCAKRGGRGAPSAQPKLAPPVAVDEDE